MKKKNRRNDLARKKPKGYDTYVNKDGVICCENFDIYGLGSRTLPNHKILKEKEKRQPRAL